MKKALLLFMALVVPFFSAYADIFENADRQAPKNNKVCTISGSTGVLSGYAPIGSSCELDISSICKSLYPDEPQPTSTQSYRTGASGEYRNKSESFAEVWCTYTNNFWAYPGWASNTTELNIGNYSTILEDSQTCPPDGYPTYLYPELGSDGGITSCLDTNSLALLDTCNINDSPPLQVTSPNACYTKSDGSKCSVTAVTLNGGNQVYMGDEGNCYENNNPDITGNPDLGGLPVGPDCVNNGGLLACPEDPTNVCGDSGTDYGGGSVNNCQAGCGYVNDAFLCYDTDIDSDGLPDYNDPDKDGDGIKNSDDLDSDGDGKDDPINSNTGTSTGSGGGSIDLTPVVNELKKLNKNFEKQADFAEFGADGKLDELNNQYELDLESFIAKGSSELGYTDVLTLSNGTAAALSALPSNECQPYTIKIQNSSSTFDMCPAAVKAKPILAWLVGMLTAWHIFILVNQTLREGL